MKAGIDVFNGHEWAKVHSKDGMHTMDVCISNLLFDEEGLPYLLASEKEGQQELRLYFTK